MTTLNIFLYGAREYLDDAPPDRRLAEGRRMAKMFLIPSGQAGTDADVPDRLVSDAMAERCVELRPPLFSVIPEFQDIVIEIERAYTLGLFFSAISAASVAIERMLNLARIELHPHHKPIKELWGKGPSNAWDENIDALREWGYLDSAFTDELRDLYRNVRCNYLHSGPLGDMAGEAIRTSRAAYRLIDIFLGKSNLWGFEDGRLMCLNESDPRYIVFFAPHIAKGT